MKTPEGYGYCPRHNKRAHHSKKAARKWRRLWHKGDAKSIYPCDNTPGTYHLGQMSAAVQVGNRQRGDFTGPRPVVGSPLMMPKQKVSA